MMAAARDRDRRRLETSGILSLLLWAGFLALMAVLKVDRGTPPADSMNPLFVELAVPDLPEGRRAEIVPDAFSSDGGSAPAARSETARSPDPIAREAASSDAAPAAAASAAPAARSEAARASPASPAASLRPDPAAAAAAPRARPSNAFQGGGDPFAPLSEDSLRAETPELPASGPESPERAPARAPSRAAAAGASSPGAAAGARDDSFSSALGAAGDRLASAAPAAGAGPAAAASGGSSKSSGSADAGGAFDFGSGASRELLSPRRVRVPDRLLAGLPNEVATRVEFDVERGGTVVPGSISFDPPLPPDLADFLRKAFGSWIFTAADSDGHVVFRYSIKVR